LIVCPYRAKLLCNLHVHPDPPVAMDARSIEWCLFWQPPCLPSAEWAAWAQALFSAAAVFAAIGVVLWQNHATRRSSEGAARFAASGLLTFIDQTIAGLQSVAQGLDEKILGATAPASQPRHFAMLLATLHLPTDDELLALNGVLPDCSITLLRARNSVRQIRTALDLLAAISAPNVDEAALPDLLLHLRQLASDAVENLVEARQALDDFAPR
jgi:hypothetical protein